MLLQLVVVVARDRVGEDREEGDHRDADHERRRGRGGAARVAPGVLARERPRQAAEAPQRRAGDAHDRAHQPAGRCRRPEDQGQRADRDQEQPGVRARGIAEHAVAERGRRAIASRTNEATSDTLPGLRSAPAPSRSAVVGLTRVARTAGTMLATSVTTTPSTKPGTSVPGVSTSATTGSVEPAAVNRANSPAAIAMPSAVPIAEATTATIAASRMTLESTWRRRSAERAQQRELAGALGDRDRERVEDDERADEQGDAAEREQDRLQDVDERAVALLGREAVGLRRQDVERHGRAEVRGLQVLDEPCRA